MKRILFLVSEDWYFLSHRLQLARAARRAGYQVTVVTHVNHGAEDIRREGFDLVGFDIRRGSFSLIREIAALVRLYRIYSAVRPCVVHHVALKPVIYGSVAARLTGIQRRVNALAGLGFVFASPTMRARLIRPVVQMVLRACLGGPKAVLIVQNSDDAMLIRTLKLAPSSAIQLIRGAGVDIDRFKPAAEASGSPVVMLATRMLRDKGVLEFVEAASLLKKQGLHARFVLAGAPDPANPTSIEESRLRQWAGEGTVEYWGWQSDMVAALHAAHIVCLPSYREGLPKVLLEASACGRPVVTTDVPGCRELVRHEDNGLIVPAKDVPALAAALRRLIESPVERMQLGRRGRIIVEGEYSESTVIKKTLALYEKVLT